MVNLSASFVPLLPKSLPLVPQAVTTSVSVSASAPDLNLHMPLS